MSAPWPGVSDLLKNTFTDNIKGLLQPANWLAATILLILNMLFIIPVFAAQNISIATYLINLNPTLQLVLAVALVLVISYLLLGMNEYIFRFMTGDWWYNSPLLGRWQQSKGGITSQSTAPDTSYEYKGFTEMSKVMQETSDRLSNFGIKKAYLFPYLENVIAEEQELTRIHNEKATLDFLVNLAFILTVFTVEQVIVQFFWQQGLAVLWAWVFLGLAFLVYKAAVSKASDWGEAVVQAFIMHRDKLRQELGLREFKGLPDECKVWQIVGDWLDSNKWPKSGISIEDALPSPQPTLIYSNNVKVNLQWAITDLSDPEEKLISVNGVEQGIQYTYQYIDYVLLVSNMMTESSSSETESSNSETKNIFIIVSDPQVPIIDTAPSAKDWNDHPYDDATAQVIIANPTDVQLVSKVFPAKPVYLARQLLWHIKTLPLQSSIVLRYRLNSRMFRVTTNKPGLETSVIKNDLQSSGEHSGAIDYELSIRNPGQVDIDNAMLEVCERRIYLPETLPPATFSTRSLNTQEPLVQRFVKERPDQSDQKFGIYRWTIPEIAQNEEVVVKYSI